jgi:hypothetical protein
MIRDKIILQVAVSYCRQHSIKYCFFYDGIHMSHLGSSCGQTCDAHASKRHTYVVVYGSPVEENG